MTTERLRILDNETSAAFFKEMINLIKTFKS